MSDVIFLSHGGGPLPLLDQEGHKEMISYYQEYSKKRNPKAIIVFSAHYEANEIKVVYNHSEELLFDYYGFPQETYRYQYNPIIDKILGEDIINRLKEAGIKASSEVRGFDHGVFVPLLLMYKNADIPVIQISLKQGLNPKEHIEIGKALALLEDVLFIGSGSSYHNLREYMVERSDVDTRNNAFQDALKEIITSDISEDQREKKLLNWETLPYARSIHPRAEHLIPLFVCYGIKQKKGTVVFDDFIFGKRNICVEW